MSPETTANTQPSCERELAIEVPADIVQKETDALVQQFAKQARLPGFRRGKVPASVIRARFAEDIKSEVVDKLVPKFFREQVEKQGLTVVSQPKVTDLKIEDGQPLRFKATFEVLPPIEVSGYKEVRAEKPEIAVTDQEVEDYLKQLQERQASFSAVEGRPLQDGDFAQVSLESRPKEETPEMKPSKLDDILVHIGGENTVKEFTEHLRGASAGDERSFDVTYADDYQEERMRGKTLSYSVKVKGVKQKSLPELNDDFAKEVGDFKDLGELRAKVREQMEHEKKHHAEHEAKDKLMDELVRRNDFPVPEALVERQIDLRLERGLRALAAQGMRTEDMKKMDFSRLRAGQREAATKEVKASLILDRIAEAEKIEVSEEELEKEVQALAAQSKQPADAVRARLTREGTLDRIRDRIRSEKTLDFLYSRSA
ncbi:MAG TPA: trigger factor [Terriglobales bacterium]|nr:trigger factor [Terriglobales bacterium]